MKGESSWDSRQRLKRRNKPYFYIIVFIISFALLLFSFSNVEQGVQRLCLVDADTIECHISYYDSLETDRDRKLYSDIYLALKRSVSGDSAFFDTGMDVLSDRKRFSQISHMVLYDHPEYSPFWCGTICVRNGSEISIQPVGTVGDMIPDSVYLDLLADLKGRDDFETAKNVFNYLANACVYDDQRGPHSSDDYGTMRLHKACCQGASFAYKRFLDLAGIPCVVITCMTNTGEYHMTPVVRLFGRWYVCEISSALGNHLDSYFCMSSEDAEKLIHELVYCP